MVVAFSVVAIGTSLPELVVTLRASLAGYPGLVLGNVVGSNIANVLLVTGAAGVVYPLASGGGTAQRDAAIMMAMSLGFALMCFMGDLTRWSGVLLLSALGVVMGVTLRSTLRSYRESVTTPLEWVLGIPSHRRMIALFLVAGGVGLPVGASMMVNAAVEIAGRLGVSETVIGLSIVAAGTSLPELATSVVAAMQRRTEVTLGTIVGSNTFNLLGIMGVGAAVSPASITISRRLLTLDLPVMLSAGLVLTLFILARRPLGRRAGVLLLAGYIGYLAVLFMSV